MPQRSFGHALVVLQALLVTFLWSTSWVLIKVGLHDIPALTFAGLRYGIAFLCLLPFLLRRERLASLKSLPRTSWGQLLLLGLLLYALTQGAQFLGLFYLPAVTVSLLLSFTPILVAWLGQWWLGERPSKKQWIGIGLFLMGAVLYFTPVSLPPGEQLGFLIAGVGVIANALSAVLGRHVNRARLADPLTVTTVSMGIGALGLLGGGLSFQGMPQLAASSWGIVLWLAVVNTAFAFTLWNHTLRALSAMESSIINNTMLIQIAVLAWLFLGETFSWQDVLGLALAATGALIVQLRT